MNFRHEAYCIRWPSFIWNIRERFQNEVKNCRKHSNVIWRINICRQDYGWNNKQKSLALSSFFWGYAVAQIPSGYIAGIWSAQMLLSIGMLLSGVFNVILPFATYQWNLVATCVSRVGMGLTQGCLLPSIHTLLSKWAPPSERARLGENRFRVRAGCRLVDLRLWGRSDRLTRILHKTREFRRYKVYLLPNFEVRCDRVRDWNAVER